MVVYEVTALVRADLCQEYERYMQETHIPDVFEAGSFVSASLLRSAAGRYRIVYTASSREALDGYLKDHAARLRKEVQEHFHDGVELSREEWDVLRSYLR